MKFSIIVPVYKVENYLNRCVVSVLNQAYKDYELILVDDGSPDLCPQMCDDFQSILPSRVKVVHKTNGGLSSARNVGLDIASGDYILFLDSDDYWDNSDVLMKMNQRIEQFHEDVILYDCEIIHENGLPERTRGNYDLDIINDHNKHKTLKYLVSKNQLPGAAWIMATKHELINQLNLRFPLGVTAEDYIWILSLLYRCQSIGAVNGSWYKYVKRGESITSQVSSSGIEGMTMALEDALQKQYHIEYPELRPYLNRLCMLVIMSYNKLPVEDKPDALVRINRVLPALSLGPKLFVSIFGMKITSFCIRLGYSLIR